MIAILDCYTDEPAGLGVPPYLGVYPRYLLGYLLEKGHMDVKYLTIDCLRLWKNFNGRQLSPKQNEKTNIGTYNLTYNTDIVLQILDSCKELYIILGVHTPGKYLSATPGTLAELKKLLTDFKGKKILLGPVVECGSQMFGGKRIEKIDKTYEQLSFKPSYSKITRYALAGAEVLRQIPDLRIIEIETSRGCQRTEGCSFCTEPLKNKLEFRKREDIIAEMKKFYDIGARHFRLGKQACIYAYPELVELLENIGRLMPGLKVLHVDNVNPVNVVDDYTNNNAKKTHAIIKYCTPGNVAAFGVESFDPEVIGMNNLNSTPEMTMRAVEILNKLGSERAENGMHRFLPGINILFGLIGESKKTHMENMKYLSRICERHLIRRINIREAIAYEGTKLQEEAGNSYLKKNSKFYWKWRNEIRQKIDLPMLKKLFPIGTVLRDLYAEIYDGNTTFMRQFGTYPIIVGTRQRYKLKEFYDVKITGHMLRSLVGNVIGANNQNINNNNNNNKLE